MEEYKQKYEQAMLRMNKWVEGSEIIDPKEVAEFVFPELKESEDERIRKWLIKAMKHLSEESTFFLEVPKDKVIAWLEKQDPKKHEEELEKAYKTADEVQYKKGYEDAKREFEKQGEQKPAWSEEDEKFFKTTLWHISHSISNSNCINVRSNTTDWLKSIKERYTWKPSDEQIKALNYVINLMASSESPTENDYYYNVLKVMRTQLKKLR